MVGSVRSAHQATFNDLSTVLANQGGLSGLEVSKWDIHLQEEPEWGYGRLQSDLSAGEDYSHHLECHHVARTRQLSDQAQSACVCERQVLLD